MKTYDSPYGLECVVNAPRPGEFDQEVFTADFPPGQLYGLDVESTALDKHLRQFHPDFRVRTIQFATTGYAWVLDLTDPDQRFAVMLQLRVLPLTSRPVRDPGPDGRRP